jgi:hypothetical protein
MGFTYEQSGGGGSGLAIKLESGDTLTLKDRIEGHFLASMATIKISWENREKLLDQFNRYFSDSEKNPTFQYKSIVIKASNEKSNLRSLTELFDNNQIRYSYAGSTGKKFKGFDYLANKEGEVTIEKGDILVSSYQPQSHFIQVMFEPDSKTKDSISYDLTAWSLPYVYNLKAFALTEKIAADTGSVVFSSIKNIASAEKPYAYVVDFSGFDELKFMALAYKNDIKLRYSLKPFTMNGFSFKRGSIIVTRGDNKYFKGDFDKTICDVANETRVKITSVSTGMVDSGKDFGSSYSPLLKKKNVALLCGEGSSSSAVGEMWYFFEQELNYPLTLFRTEDVQTRTLDDYDILILASGSYSDLKETILDFAKRGGRVIALENSVALFAAEKSTALGKAVDTRNAELKAAEKKIKSDDTSYLRKYEINLDRRYSLSDRSAGSIYRVKTDDTNPYAFGLGKEWFVMKRSAGYPFLPTGNNIGYILEKEPLAGFAGFKYKDKIKNTLVIGSEQIGSGEVIYITDNPYFRAFWKSGRILIGNAVLR